MDKSSGTQTSLTSSSTVQGGQFPDHMKYSSSLDR